MRPIGVQVTTEQAKLVADAITRRDALTREATLLVSALSAGHVPSGATLIDVNVDTGMLTFHAEHDTGDDDAD